MPSIKNIDNVVYLAKWMMRRLTARLKDGRHICVYTVQELRDYSDKIDS